MELENKKMSVKRFHSLRKRVLETWPTGNNIDLREGIKYCQSLPKEKRFSMALKRADQLGRVLIQPRCGVALLEEFMTLLNQLERESDLLSATIDAYTRNNMYADAESAIEKSIRAGHSLLNGFPAVNHGLAACRKIVESIDKPIQVRHGTPDARLLAEITLAGGFSSFEGGSITYNIPYAKRISIEQTIFDWQYVDRLAGMYEEEGVTINRESFGALSGTLIPPFISHAIGIIEGLLALEQGVKSITLGYTQTGNLIQDIAAIKSLRDIAHLYFRNAGFQDYELSTVFHQWMGGFPEEEAKAFGVICWGAVTAALSKATKVMVKTPHEARGIPTAAANLQGIMATRQIIQMLADQPKLDSVEIDREEDVIRMEVKNVMDAVIMLGKGDMAQGTVKAFEAGVIDVPFVPSTYNKGKMISCRDDRGAVRVLDPGNIPLAKPVMDYHREKLAERAIKEKRGPDFNMVIDDVYAIGKGALVGRPRGEVNRLK